MGLARSARWKEEKFIRKLSRKTLRQENVYDSYVYE
jgi:hypothetical protein